MHGREARLEAAGIGEQLNGGATVGGAALLIPSRCSETWAWSGTSRARAQPATSFSSSGRSARTLCAAPAMRAVSVGSSASTRSTQAPTLASAKRRWKPFDRLVVPAVQVASVQEGQPHAGGRRGRDDGFAHGVWIGVGRPVRLVVHVVKLADERDSGQRHLGKGRRGEVQVAVRSELAGSRVHRLAPGPERPRWRCVRPRSLRWNACECAFARPGRVKPRTCSAPGGASALRVTARIRPPSISSTTPLSTVSRPSQARSHQSRLTSPSAPPPAARAPRKRVAGSGRTSPSSRRTGVADAVQDSTPSR